MEFGGVGHCEVIRSLPLWMGIPSLRDPRKLPLPLLTYGKIMNHEIGLYQTPIMTES